MSSHPRIEHCAYECLTVKTYVAFDQIPPFFCKAFMSRFGSLANPGLQAACLVNTGASCASRLTSTGKDTASYFEAVKRAFLYSEMDCVARLVPNLL